MARRVPAVVVVDDDPVMVTLLERMLSSKGWRVRAFTDPEQALESLLEDVPHLLVTDLAMPRLDGRALADTLRAALGADVPKIVCVTAHHKAGREPLEGFDLVVGKPFRIATLELELRALLGDAISSGTRIRRPGALDDTHDEERESGT